MEYPAWLTDEGKRAWDRQIARVQEMMARGWKPEDMLPPALVKEPIESLVSPKSRFRQQSTEYRQTPMPGQFTPTVTEQPEPTIGELPQGWDYRTAQFGPSGEELPYGAVGWTPIGTPYYGRGIVGWWRGIVSRLTAPIEPVTVTARAPGVPEKAITPPAWAIYPKRIIGEAVNQILGLIGGVAEATVERPLAVSIHGMEEMGRDSPLPSISELPKPLVRLATMILPSSIPAYNAIRAWTAPGDSDEKLEVMQRHWEAGRILYTSFITPSAYSEFLRRYEGGEDPALLEMELENPFAEFAGEFVFDPLNIIGAGAGKARDARWLRNAKEEFLNLAPELEKIFNASVRTVGEGRVVDNIEELLKVHQSVLDRVEQGLTKLANEHGLSSLTTEGKQFVVSRRATEIVRWLVANARNPEDVLETLHGLALSASVTSNEQRIQGLTTILHSVAPRPLLSEAGLTTAIILRNMLVDEEGVVQAEKFLGGLRDARARGVSAAVDYVAGKMNATIQKMFPTVLERLERGEKLEWWVEPIARFDKGLMRKLYRPLNTFFGSVYMGLSPGYAFRNLWTNELSIFVDYGVSGLRHMFSPSKALDEIKAYLGGVIPEAVRGFGGAGATEEILTKARGLPGFVLAEKGELIGSIQVVAHLVRQTMDKALRVGRALPDIASLVDVGLPEESARTLVRLIVNHRGDVDAALREFIELANLGDLDVSKLLMFLTADEVRKLRDFRIYDTMVEKLSDVTTKEDAQRVISEAFQSLYDIAEKAVDDVPVVSRSNPAIEVVSSLGAARESGEVGEHVVEFATHYTEANAQALHMYQVALNNAYRYAVSPQHVRRIDDIDIWFKKYSDVLTGATANKIRAEQTARRTVTLKFRDEALKDGFDAAKAWRVIFGTDPPALLTPRLFLKELWEKYYFGYVRELWQNYREDYAELVRRAFGELRNIIHDVPDKEMSMAEKMLQYAREYDKFLREDEIRFALSDAIQRGDNATALRVIAHKYNIPSVSETGALLDKRILNIINSYREEFSKASDVRQIPIGIVEDVLRQKALQLRKSIYEGDSITLIRNALDKLAEYDLPQEKIDLIADILNGMPEGVRITFPVFVKNEDFVKGLIAEMARKADFDDEDFAEYIGRAVHRQALKRMVKLSNLMTKEQVEKYKKVILYADPRQLEAMQKLYLKFPVDAPEIEQAMLQLIDIGKKLHPDAVREALRNYVDSDIANSAVARIVRKDVYRVNDLDRAVFALNYYLTYDSPLIAEWDSVYEAIFLEEVLARYMKYDVNMLNTLARTVNGYSTVSTVQLEKAIVDAVNRNDKLEHIRLLLDKYGLRNEVNKEDYAEWVLDVIKEYFSQDFEKLSDIPVNVGERLLLAHAVRDKLVSLADVSVPDYTFAIREIARNYRILEKRGDELSDDELFKIIIKELPPKQRAIYSLLGDIDPDVAKKALEKYKQWVAYGRDMFIKSFANQPGKIPEYAVRIAQTMLDSITRGKSNPRWYDELIEQGLTRRKITSSLKKIISGNDLIKRTDDTMILVKGAVWDEIEKVFRFDVHELYRLGFEDDAAKAFAHQLELKVKQYEEAGIAPSDAAEKVIAEAEDMYGSVAADRLFSIAVDKGYFDTYATQFAKHTTSELLNFETLDNHVPIGNVMRAYRLRESVAHGEDIADFLRGTAELLDYQQEKLVEKFSKKAKAIVADKPRVPPYTGETPPSLPRLIREQLDGLREFEKRILGEIEANWGRKIPTILDRKIEAAVKRWSSIARERIAEARMLAVAVASAGRDFTLLVRINKCPLGH